MSDHEKTFFGGFWGWKLANAEDAEIIGMEIDVEVEIGWEIWTEKVPCVHLSWMSRTRSLIWWRAIFFFLYENMETILELWRKYFHTCREWVERFIVNIFRMWQKPWPSWILSTCLQAEKYAKKRCGGGGNKEKNISCRIKCSPAIIPNEMVTRGLRCVVAALLPSPREKQI